MPKPKVIEDKVCCACKRPKPLSAFYRNKRSKDGRQGNCKECSSRIATEWKRAHPDAWREESRRRRAKARNLSTQLKEAADEVDPEGAS